MTSLRFAVPEVDTSYFTSNIAVGGRGGRRFYYGLRPRKPPASGTVVRSLKAWWSPRNKIIRGLEIELTNGWRRTFGKKAEGYTERFYIDAGEKISSLKIWYRQYRTGRIGGFELITDRNRKFSVSPEGHGNPYKPELGSGILVGVYGGHGGDIDYLGFGLVRRARAEMISVNYPDLNTLKLKTLPKNINTITYDNSKGTASQVFTFTGSESVTTAESWSMTTGLEAGVETTIKAQAPIISAEVKVSFKLSVSGTYKRSNTKTTTRSFNFPVKVPPGKRLRAIATLYEGTINTRYMGVISYTLDSGKKFRYRVSGTYRGISASEVAVKVVEMNKK